MSGFQSKRIMANDKLKGATVKALVRTTIIQEIEIPEDADKQDVLNFLADNQWFGDAFNGISDPEQRFRTVSCNVAEEEVIELGEEAYDD